jgi:hypothetical protein
MSATLIVGQTADGQKRPVQVNPDGQLAVDAKATISTDLSVIEGNLTTIAADLALGVIAGVPSVKMNDGAGNALTSTNVNGKQAIDVNIVAGGGGGGNGGASAAYNSTLPTYTSGQSSTLQTDVNGRLITANPSALPLPSGAAQDGTDATGITAPAGGSGIRGWLSGIYQKLSNALAVTQSGTWTMSVQGGNSTAVKVDGSAAIQLGSGVVTATTQRVTLATDGPEVTNSTAIKNNTANIPAKGAATTANSTPVNIASDQTVPVSASSLPLPSGASTAANQTTANSSLASIATNTGNIPALVSGRVPVDGSGVTQPVSGTVAVSNFPATQPVSGTVAVSGTVPVSGPLTDTQLRASAVPVSASSLPLPSGAATAANQTTANTSLASIATNTGNIPALVSGRVPVDGSGVTQPVSGTVAISNFPATQPVSGTVAVSGTVPVSASSLPLPSGASTSALQTSGNTSLANLDADVGNVADAVATSDTGSFSLIALTKRLLGKFSVLTDGTAKSQIVNGANTLAIDASGFPTVNTPVTTASYNQTGVIAVNTILVGPLSVSQFRTISIQVTSLGTSGAITGELSNDNATWLSIGAQAYTTGGASANNISTTGMWLYQLTGAAYFRLRLSTATTAGTTTLYVQGSKEVYPWSLQTVSISGNPVLGSGNNLIGLVTPNPQTTFGSFSLYHTLISAASTNATNVKSTAGNVGSIYLTNTTASLKYLKLFNLATAPTVGTSTPVLNYAIPPNTSINVDTVFGIRLGTGIAYAITGGSALLDTTAVAAGDVIVNMTYV